MVRFNGADFFYVYNLQDDVVAIVDANASQVVEYTYDAGGVVLSKTGSFATTLRYITPDVDSHNGGFWKAADSVQNLARKSTRSGTYSSDLTLMMK